MDGVWSRAGASGTPQTAQATQAGPSYCDGAWLSFSPCLSLHPDSFHCLPPFSSLIHFPFPSLSLFPQLCLSATLMTKCIHFHCSSCLILSFPSTNFLPPSSVHPHPFLITAHFPLLTLFFPPCDDCTVVWLVLMNKERSFPSIVYSPLHSFLFLLDHCKSCVVLDWYSYLSIHPSMDRLFVCLCTFPSTSLSIFGHAKSFGLWFSPIAYPNP